LSVVDVSSRESIAVSELAVERAEAGGATELMPAADWNLGAWLLSVYLAGAAVLLARLIIGTVRVSSLSRDARVVNGRLTSARIATPITFGVLRPTILLPDGWEHWPAARLAVVLDHEQAHMDRRDPLVQWLALLNRALFWFHPLAWWLERHLAKLAEEACDAAVLARGHDAADYSEHLLDFARVSGLRRVQHVVGMPMPGSALPARIAKILDGDLQRAGSRRAVVGAAALAALAAAALGTITLAQEPVAPARQPAAPAQPTAPTPAQAPAAPVQAAVTPPWNLLETYQLALQNGAVARDAEGRATSDYEAARQALLMQVAEAYFNVLAAQETLVVEEAARAALSRQLEQAQRRFEVGLIPLTDVKETQAASEQAVVKTLTAERAVASAQQALRQIVGTDVGELSPVVEPLPLDPPDPASAEEWIEAALQRNPALISARIRARVVEGDAGAEQSRREDLERMARQTEIETRDAYLGVIAEISRVLALRQAVRSSEDALRATQAGFETGTRTTVDVLMAEHTFRQTQATYALSGHDYVLNVLRLQRAVGALTPQGLQELGRWFE
jgi:outer membrane protein